jgi:hypothetical protein
LFFLSQLKSFDSFKLHCADHLTFPSNELSEIRLHQAEFLSSLTIWAPRLRYLNLQASNPSRITIQDTHAMLETHPLPKGFTPTPIQVFTLNATCLRSQLSSQLQEYLTGHPRVKCAHTFESDEDEGTCCVLFLKSQHALFGPITLPCLRIHVTRD